MGSSKNKVILQLHVIEEGECTNFSQAGEREIFENVPEKQYLLKSCMFLIHDGAQWHRTQEALPGWILYEVEVRRQVGIHGWFIGEVLSIVLGI